MAEARPGKPVLWITHAAKLIAGDAVCEFYPWFRAHFRSFDEVKDSTFDFASWTVDHTALVNRRADELRADGWRVTLEDANKFWFHGENGTLGGKADIIAEKPGRILISDGKTGKARHADYVQVVLYMILVPRCFKRWKEVAVEGEVVYRDGVRSIGGHERTPERVLDWFSTLRRFCLPEAPEKRPSAAECARCPVAATECPERAIASDVAVGTSDGDEALAGF